ncbi:MAG: hypothetical protein PWR10_850 [Halanaerobiales bacterium]|nr:hypothetical protein [Halanaerobiales bacterium]
MKLNYKLWLEEEEKMVKYNERRFNYFKEG